MLKTQTCHFTFSAVIKEMVVLRGRNTTPSLLKTHLLISKHSGMPKVKERYGGEVEKGCEAS